MSTATVQIHSKNIIKSFPHCGVILRMSCECLSAELLSWESMEISGAEHWCLSLSRMKRSSPMPALREVLSLLRPEIHDAELAEIISKLRSERSGDGSWSSLVSAMELHNLNVSCAEHLAGRKLAVLCECLLNYTMAMSEMLTEERCDVLRLVVEIRSCERVAKRFKDQKVPLTDANEHWRHELDDWRALLAPFSWKNSRASVMSQALLAADLCEPLTKHVDLVRSFEYLRCLGGGLIDEEMQSAIKKLQQHGEKYSCWKASEVSEAVLTAYRKSVIFARTAAVLPKDVLDAEATAKTRGSLHSAAEAMGFLPSALTGKIPLPVLGHLTGRLLSLAEQEGKAQQDSDLVQKLCRSLAETAQMCKDNIFEAPHQLCLNFLLQVGKEYLTRATPTRQGTHLNFELLAGGSPSMQLLRNLETHPEAQRLLGNMALSELLQVASLIREAHSMVHGDNLPFAHAGLQRWLARLKVDSSLHPADISELSAALEDFLKQNYAARIAGQEEALPSCLLRVLQRLETGSRHRTLRAPHLGRHGPFEAMWKSRCRLQVIVIIVMAMMLRPLITLGPNLYVSQHAFLSKPSQTTTSPMSRVNCKQSSESRVFHKPSNPKWTWPLSLVILTFSLSASNVQPLRLSSSKVGLARQAFAGGLEGCDHHGAGRYEFDPLNFCELFPENLPWYREAEVKHGRVAMLAYAGLVMPDFFRFPDPIFKQTGLDPISAHNMLLGGAGRGAMWCLLLSCGALEFLRMCQLGLDFELLTLDTAGDFGLGSFLPEDEDISILKTQELKHGHLAMIAFGGAITQAVACNAHHFPFITCSTC
eukprot:s932_g5.t1